MQKRKNKKLDYSSFASTFTLNNFVDFDQNLTKIHGKWLNFSEKIDFFWEFKIDSDRAEIEIIIFSLLYLIKNGSKYYHARSLNTGGDFRMIYS